MHIIRTLSVALAVTVAPSVIVAQPFSTSMAQRAGLYGGVSQHLTKPENLEKFASAEAAFYLAAIEQAKTEGRKKPVDAIDAEYGAAWDDWAGRNAFGLMSQEFRDWAEYCRKFAKDRGIDTGL